MLEVVTLFREAGLADDSKIDANAATLADIEAWVHEQPEQPGPPVTGDP